MNYWKEFEFSEYKRFIGGAFSYRHDDYIIYQNTITIFMTLSDAVCGQEIWEDLYTLD